MINIMINNTPNYWKLEKLGQLFNERKEKVSDKDYSPLSVAKHGIVPQMANVAKSDDGDNRKKVLIGDFVINSRSDRRGSSGLSIYNGSVSLINIVLEPRHGYPKFIHHLLKSYAFQEEFYKYGHGIVADLWTTRYSELKSIIVALPKYEEQKQIANFLDKEIERIDLLIERKERLLGLLHEKRNNIISNLILESNQESRKKYKIKHIVELRTMKLSYKDTNASYIGLENIKSWTGDIKIDAESSPDGLVSQFYSGDVLFGKLRPNLAKVAVVNFDGVCSTEAIVLKPKKVLASYLKYMMLEKGFIEDIVSSTYGARMPRASWGYIGSKLIDLPSITDQKKVISLINEKLKNISNISQKTEDSIKLLLQFKSSIITEAITGQLNIKEWQNRGLGDQKLDKINKTMTA